MEGRTIGGIARAAGVGVETIRYYERRGLIEQPPKPPLGGFRRYPESAVQVIRFIRQAQHAGFSLREIALLLRLQTDPASDCTDVRAQAVAKRDEVNRKIAGLEAIRDGLEQLISACPGSGPARACSILETLSQPQAIQIRNASISTAPEDSRI
jgi:DNA-binding transcriptional MerR regulator